MKTPEELRLQSEVVDLIVDKFEAEVDMTFSDLTGMAMVLADDIIKLVKAS